MPRPEDIRIIVATDCGSTTTKAILIQLIEGEYRQTFRGESPTTVEEPLADVTVGVINAISELQELAGRKLLDDSARIIRPAEREIGCDLYISTSSAGGGLQMVVAGLVREMTAASAERAALSAGAIVLETLAGNDRRPVHEQIRRIRNLRPDMLLLAGGTDGGNIRHVVEIAERIAPAKPLPRFGGDFRLPVVFSGNGEAAAGVAEAFRDTVDLKIVDNLRPDLESEQLAPARDAIHELFLEHVMAQAPGYRKLIEWTDAPVMPTPGAVGKILQSIAERESINVLGVDIGGATTDVFSVFCGEFNRTVSANLGMSYSISNVCASATLPKIMRWVHLEMDERELRNRIKNKMIRPTTIPQTLEALVFEQAVAREALRLAFAQHCEFAVAPRGGLQPRGIGDMFRQRGGPRSLVDPLRMDLLVASGGVLSHAPRLAQTAAMLIDSFEPAGFTRLAKDSIFMMPHLGVLSEVHPRAALDVFERDCLITLGYCVAAAGQGRIGDPCFDYELTHTGGHVQGEVRVGELQRLELDQMTSGWLVVRPRAPFDLGNGPGKTIRKEVYGGSVGLILDARGRPIRLPENREACRGMMSRWYSCLGLFPQEQDLPGRQIAAT